MQILCRADKAIICTRVKFTNTTFSADCGTLDFETMWSGTNVLEKTITSTFSVDIYAYIYTYVS